MTVILMHHDIIDPKSSKKTGFSGPGAELYKVGLAQFEEELTELSAAFPGEPPGLAPQSPYALTFDDGGASAVDIVADVLAARSFRAHFFIVTGVLGLPGFVQVSGLRRLLAAGHTIGTHTVTHAHRLTTWPYARIFREWNESAERLRDLLGCPVTCGSIPGGYSNKAVREAAMAAGLSQLFSSEPTTRRYETEALQVYGRFPILSRDPASAVVGLAKRAYARRVKAWRWHALGVAKNALGPVYPALREGLLRLRAS